MIRRTAPQSLPIDVVKAPFTRGRTRSTSFNIVSKSGTLKGCVQTGTLQMEPFRSKKWSD